MLSRRLLRIKIIKALFAHFKSEADSLIVSEKNLIYSIDKTYELYHLLLWLPVEIAKLAEMRIESGKNKKLPTPEELTPNTKFIDNSAIHTLRNSNNLIRFLESKKLSWANHPELIKKLYNELILSDYYQHYMDNPARSFKEDLELLEKFFTYTVCESELLEQVVEEQSIFWCDDIDFATIMVLRSLADTRPAQTEVTLLTQYKNTDDLAFVKEVFRHALVHFHEYAEYINRFTSNWEVDRIAFMDNVIMVAAMTEVLQVPSVPVKVTLDEFIEISKYYSTPGSSTFINGVLDRVVEALTAENKIQKTGRGLLDK